MGLQFQGLRLRVHICRDEGFSGLWLRSRTRELVACEAPRSPVDPPVSMRLQFQELGLWVQVSRDEGFEGCGQVRQRTRGKSGAEVHGVEFEGFIPP